MGEDVTIKELAEMIKEVVGYTGEVVFDSKKPDGPLRKLMDVSYMQTLGWTAKTALKQGLFETYEFFLNLEHSSKND
jgi:GDP-L-fucose synthase